MWMQGKLFHSEIPDIFLDHKILWVFNVQAKKKRHNFFPKHMGFLQQHQIAFGLFPTIPSVRMVILLPFPTK